MNNWIFFALSSAFFAGLTAFFGKIGVKNINSDLATFIRTIVILLVTSLIITFKSEWIKPENISKKSIIFLILSGIATGLSWISYYRALQLGPVNKVAPIDKLSIIFAIVLAFLFLGEKISWQILSGSIFIVLGSLIIVFAN